MGTRAAPSEETIRERVEQRYGQDLVRWVRDLSASLRGARGTLPVEARSIACAIGAALRETQDPASCGSTRHLGGNRYEIHVSPGLDPRVENFTIAHEIAHVMMHRMSDGNFVDGDAVEHTCDLLAAHLLCPLPVVDAALRQTGLNLATTSFLSDVLGVPEQHCWLFVSHYYPATFFSGRAHHIATLGRFALGPFSQLVDEMIASERATEVRTIEKSAHGVSRWSLEVSSDERWRVRGLLKPYGSHAKQELPVRAVGNARTSALEESIDDWTLPADRNMSKTEGALR